MLGRTIFRAARSTGFLRSPYGLSQAQRYSAVAHEAASLPLAGYRVLDMTRVLAANIGPNVSAEVIKVEHPTRGDDTRAWGPPYATYREGSDLEGPGESAYFLAINRNKKSLGLSFQHPEGVEILHKLAAKCDILVENYLPGTLKKYGMDFETLHKINPALIYASITGFGQNGPYSQRAGYDVMVEAEFGLMHITGNRDGPPVKVGVAVTDLTTGLYTSNSIMAALLSRARTGRGQHIDIALSDCQLATLANIASSCLISGKKDSGRWGTAHPSIVPYKSFKTKDGDILFGGGNDRLFGVLCDGLGRPEWKTDPKYGVNSQRVANRAELEAEIEKISVQKTTQEWLDIFEGKGMPYAAVNDVQASLHHEQSKARDMVVEVEHEQCGPIKLVNTPVKYSESKPRIRTAPPTLGQHTDEILGDLLGLEAGEVSVLKEKGAVRVRRTLALPRHQNRSGAFWLWCFGDLNSPRTSNEGKGGATSVPPPDPAPPQPAPSENPTQTSPPETPASSSSSTLTNAGLSSVSSPGRPPYIPQFSASTQMILKRINGQPGSLSSALSSASPFATGIERSTFEDAKRRLVMNMSTSLNMTIPSPRPASSYSAARSAATLPLPMNDAFQLRTPAPTKLLPAAEGPAPAPKAPAPAQKENGRGPRPAKRKRANGNERDNNEVSSSLSDLSESEIDAAASAAAASAKDQATPTMTKSGRQVQKPSQYNPSPPSTQSSQSRRKHSGGGSSSSKRMADQVLCKVCTRGLSPAGNRIVFCDSCNGCWHQLCHQPYIDDDVVEDESRVWFCSFCTAKRERLLARKKGLDAHRGVSWAAKSADQVTLSVSPPLSYAISLCYEELPHSRAANVLPQKRNYLNGVPHAQLVNIIMYCTELHPDLPIFPSNESGRRAGGGGPAFDSPIRYTRKVSTPDSHLPSGGGGGGGASKSKLAADSDRDRVRRGSSADSVPPAWPQVGKGCLDGLPVDEDDLRDDNDYEAFSVTTYDDKGNKIVENGMRV
ncbi:CoA-transferase family III domain-containing protein [Durotheca rogersii]|uniref:CoA-transferase family III domain-containing protein n=1 Tax=Durotheca rogersii TaxID=419775 RepID=UPI00221E67B5|nr:CoA-transferase family III domain-containing protein [Durotheca rogersii]KAI5862536.1 CoA-transferase family III domain-containing protein [Durotheca rogersii]